MKIKLTIINIAFGLLSSVANAQVTIGSLDPPHSSAVLELKISDKGFLGPRVDLIDIWDKATVPDYTEGLLVLNMHDSDKNIPIGSRVKSGKYYYWNVDRWVEVVATRSVTENVEQILSMKGIPRPAMFTLNGNQHIFSYDPVGGGSDKYDNMLGVINLLKGVQPNQSAYVPLRERLNYTSGTVVLDSVSLPGNNKKFTITFQPGIYSIIFTYEFVPADTAEDGSIPHGHDRCWSAVYFMEFPVNIINDNGTISTGLTRVESNCYHGPGQYKYKEGRYADHGNTISYVAVLLTETVWEVKFGTGYGDDYCNGYGGFSMPNRSTFLYISRMGDAQ